jgi:hypothetical protein
VAIATANAINFRVTRNLPTAPKDSCRFGRLRRLERARLPLSQRERIEGEGPYSARDSVRARFKISGIRTQDDFDFIEHFVRICQHPLIPEAQDPVALRSEKRAPSLVFGGLLGVLAAIDLHDQTPFNRAEIHEVRTNRMLATELYAAHPLASQMPPKDLLPRVCSRRNLRAVS